MHPHSRRTQVLHAPIRTRSPRHLRRSAQAELPRPIHRRPSCPRQRLPPFLGIPFKSTATRIHPSSPDLAYVGFTLYGRCQHHLSVRERLARMRTSSNPGSICLQTVSSATRIDFLRSSPDSSICPPHSVSRTICISFSCSVPACFSVVYYVVSLTLV